MLLAVAVCWSSSSTIAARDLKLTLLSGAADVDAEDDELVVESCALVVALDPAAEVGTVKNADDSERTPALDPLRSCCCCDDVEAAGDGDGDKETDDAEPLSLTSNLDSDGCCELSPGDVSFALAVSLSDLVFLSSSARSDCRIASSIISSSRSSTRATLCLPLAPSAPFPLSLPSPTLDEEPLFPMVSTRIIRRLRPPRRKAERLLLCPDPAASLPNMYAAVCSAVAAAERRKACARASASFFAQSGRTRSVVMTLGAVADRDVARRRIALEGDADSGAPDVADVANDVVDDTADVALRSAESGVDGDA